jgi:hypothetical protein
VNRLATIICAASLTALTAACAGQGTSLAYADGGGPYDGFYDGYYGPFNDGYWGGDGFFYNSDGFGGFLPDRGNHFRHTGGSGFHGIHTGGGQHGSGGGGGGNHGGGGRGK